MALLCLIVFKEFKRYERVTKEDSLENEYGAFRVNHQTFAREEAVIQIKDEIERNRQTIERLRKRNVELEEALEKGKF